MFYQLAPTIADVHFPDPIPQIQGKSAQFKVSNQVGNSDNRDMAAIPQRTIQLLRSPNTDGVGVFCVRTGDKSTYYTFGEIPCDIGGRGYAVHRLGLGDVYHVRIGNHEDCSCECMGFLRHGYCRHVLGLLALRRNDLV